MKPNIYEEILNKYSLDELAKGRIEIQPVVITPANISEPQNYLILDSHTHHSYSYPDLYVAKTLSHHGKTWYDSHAVLHQEGMFMPTLRQFVDFLSLLKSGKAFDGKGQKVPSSELEAILKEITEQRAPWRAEWLDANFKRVNKVLHINYAHQTIKGKLQPKYSEPLQGCLMEDNIPSIDLNDYLQRATFQGLPPADASSGSLYYWSPGSGLVARFWASAVGVCLGCRRDPRNSGTALGVRRAQAKIF